MLPSSVLAFSFPRTSRDRGNAYVRPGLVTIVQGNSDEVVAAVQGTDRYDVRIRRESRDGGTSFVVFCSCGYIDQRAEACKHVWAALIVAERSGYLRSEYDPPLERESTFLGVESPWRGRAPGATPVRQASRAPRAPAASAFFANVSRELEERDAAGTEPPRYQDVSFLYVIDAHQSRDAAHVVVHVMGQERIRHGGVKKPKTLRLSLRDVSVAPPADRRILALLFGAPARDPNIHWNDDRERPATFELPGPLAVELLPLIARTARAWFQAGPDAQVLEPVTWDDGNAWRFDLRIESIPTGYRVTGALVRDEVNVPVTEKFQVLAGGLVVVRRKIARLDLDASAPFLRALARSGPVETSAADAQALAEAIAESGVPLDKVPDELRVEEIRVAPRPRVRLEQRPDRTQGWLTAELSFDYGGVLVLAGARRTSIFHKPSKRVIHRDRTAEADAERHLMELGFRSEWYPTGHEIEIAVHQMGPAVRALVGDGWHVEADGVRHRMPAPIDLEVTSGIDWFDLSATVSFDGETIPLTEILAALKPGEQTIRLGDGSVGLLPEDWAERYGGLTATGEIDDNRIRFHRSQAAILDAILATREADSRIRVDELFERARREIASFANIEPEEAPSSFSGVLRAYQKQGLGWFTFLRTFQFGGCLADDMGLGKTIMVLALLDARRQQAEAGGIPHLPSLVVVPRSLVGNWMAEAKNFTPGLRLLDHSHSERSPSATSFDSTDAVLVTYGTLRRDIAALSSAEFDYVILDEAQTIKNATTASAKAARLVRARHRLALSGTPVENHLGELWSLFEFLNPGILGRSTAFKRLSSSGDTDDATTALIARGLRPFILRRTKRQVARELPERTENTIVCELLPKDRRLYDALRHHYRTTLLDRIDQDGLAKSKIHVLEALLRLRQVACHAGLIDPTRVTDDSAKFEALLPQLEEVVAEGHKAIVFSQFTTLLGLLRQRLDAAKLPYEYLDGKTRDRAKRVERFQTDPAVPLFLVSLKAGGLGLNLTAAEYVFLLDPWWNPAVEAQAIDRAHRIGQTREVFAYRLIAKDTVEEKVLALQQSKRDLADAVLSANTVGLRDLSRDDLELLLS